MIEFKTVISNFVSKYVFELSSGAVGSASTFVIDWNHIAERAVETTVIAAINGGVAGVSGYILLRLIKWVFPEKK